MATRALEIQGMSCGHCIKAVTLALQELPGVEVRDGHQHRVTDAVLVAKRRA